MNYFAHALAFLDDPYFAAGTGVPDMLMVADRGLKLRMKHARAFLHDADTITAAVAGGVYQHLIDDRSFHKTTAFAEASLALTIKFRDALDDKSGLRPRFLGHLMVELLLDAALIAENPAKLERYYTLLESVDVSLVEEVVNRMTPRTTSRLSAMIHKVNNQRFLWDYLDDAKLTVRVNQVMRRVGLDLVPSRCFQSILSEARRLVAARKSELLAGTSAARRRIDKPNSENRKAS